MPNAAKCGWGPPSPPLHRPDRFPALFRLLVCATGVIHVVTAQSVGPRITIMKTFTIDEQNNITAFGTQEEAAATTTSPFDSFASQKDLPRQSPRGRSPVRRRSEEHTSELQ